MNKLNNGGWGLVEMLILSGILLIALLVAVYFIYVLYNSFWLIIFAWQSYINSDILIVRLKTGST